MTFPLIFGIVGLMVGWHSHRLYIRYLYKAMRRMRRAARGGLR